MQEFTVQLFDNGSAQISGTGANLELRFGYSKNAHIYSVKFIRSKEWEDLYIRVHFHPEADIYDIDPVLAQNNIVNIPAMVTSMPGKGKLTIEGTDGYKTITSADILYRVSENSGIDSETDPEPGESSFQQFVDAIKEDAKSAEQAAKDAESALAETKEAVSLALSDIETARTNAISDIEKIESEVKGEIQEDVESAKSSAEAASKSAEEAKSAADSAKKSLSDLETAKQSALSEISKEKDTSVGAIGSAKEAALNEVSTSGNSAIQNVKIAETNAINSVETEGSTQKTALNNASNAALTSIDTAKTNAVKAVEDKASEESSAIDQKSNEVIQDIQNAGDSELSAISEATSSAIEQITQSAGQHLTQIDSAADEAVTDIMNAKEDSLEEIEGVNAHPPIQNPETGKWQIWNAETSSYVDTAYDWEGGYYSPSVDSEGNLTWEGSKEGMEDIPSTNIRGPQGLGVPTSTANDYGKAPTVNASGTGYELIGPYAPLSAAITETAKGNPAVCEDSVEWGLQGVRVYGKSTQDGTPSPESPVPIVSAGESGGIEIAVTGRNLLNISRCSTFAKSYGLTPVIDGDSVLISGTATITMSIASFTILTTNDEFLVGRNFEISWFTDQAITSIYGLTTNNKINLAMSLQEGQSYNFAIKISVWLEKLDVWEPYTGQSLTLSTPNGLPGIPVDSGGNYTDASGKRRWADVVDYSNEKKYQYINEVVVDGTNVKFTANSTNVYWNLPANSAPSAAQIVKTQINKYFPSDVFSVNGEREFIFTESQNMAPYFETAEELNAFCVQKNTEGNPLTIMYVMDTPIETPIPADELAAYRVLHTYDSTTVITMDDALAEVEVDYIVKPKAYIEKKLTAIESRLNALEISEALEGE